MKLYCQVIYREIVIFSQQEENLYFAFPD